jgi:hypothetical protein
MEPDAVSSLSRRKFMATSLATLIACSLIALLVALADLGGMSPSYRPTDYDRRLTPIAREAVPIIKSIDQYRSAHGHCPRVTESDLTELRNSLSGDFVATLRGQSIEFRAAATITGWRYYSDSSDPMTCQLSRKLGWDPDLVWRRHEDKTKWIFAPGDGSDETAIDLDIER